MRIHAEKRTIMKFQMYHENYNVTDLDKSLAFYEKALGLKEKRRVNGEVSSLHIWEMTRAILSWS